MSTSERCYVWTWLPGDSEPVPAGLLANNDGRLVFRYGSRYRERPNAMALGPDLPLGPEHIDPEVTLEVAGSLRDASPDAWGRQVIDFRRSGILAKNADIGMAPELTYMLESGSNRFGAIDFQHSPREYVHRGEPATLEELVEGAERISQGKSVPEEIGHALGHGTTMGGARPKATVTHGNAEYVAKFSRHSDTYDVVGAEAAAMFLAREAGVDVPATHLVRIGDKKVLLVRRFDRTDEGLRRHVVSGLTLSGLTEMTARYGTYPALLGRLLRDGKNPGRYGKELYRRVALNIAVSNNDDHLRNHATFWDGRMLDLTPAYDICPQPRSGESSTQALGMTDDPNVRASTYGTLHAARAHYGLDSTTAREIIDEVTTAVDAQWAMAAEVGEIRESEAGRMRTMQILNPAAFFDYEPSHIRQSRRASTARDSSSMRECGAWMPKRAAYCTKPEGHFGWPTSGHQHLN